MNKHATRGGARLGAGRPKGSTNPDARRNNVAVRLSDADLAKARSRPPKRSAITSQARSGVSRPAACSASSSGISSAKNAA